MKRKNFIFSLFLIPLLFVSCKPSGNQSVAQQVTNLRAFAKLYGYVRFFHPSDEASKIDWNKFAIYGAGKVRQAKTTEELKTALQSLFKPIAPTIQIYFKGETPKDVFSMFPKDTAGLHITAWQHRGVYLGNDTAVYGYKSLRIDEEAPDSTHLFAKFPHIGEVINKPLDGGLSCIVPLALYKNEKGTLGSDPDFPFASLAHVLDSIQLDSIHLPPINNIDDHLADIVIVWNIMRHFYPYFNDSEIHWDDELTDALKGTLADSSDLGFFAVFKKMVAGLNDGHAWSNWDRAPLFYGALPCRLQWIENKIVVTATDDSNVFQLGDVIESYDGVKADEELRRSEELISGSPQWKKLIGLNLYGGIDTTSKADIVLLRDNKEIKETVAKGHVPEEFHHKKIEELSNGVYYIDLRVVTDSEMQAEEKILSHDMDSISAKGFIFDVRGYPGEAAKNLLTHLTDKTMLSLRWMFPETIYPDQENIAGYDTSGRWVMKPEKPRFGGKIIFLTDAGAISFGESVMGIVEYYKLGEIVGETTPGTDGNVNPLDLPDGIGMNWTGMKVLKNDGSQLHLVGIKPTVPVERTMQGVKEGRDEVLEKAIEIIKGSK